MMILGRTLLRFFFLAAIGHQLTYTLVESGILEPSEIERPVLPGISIRS